MQSDKNLKIKNVRYQSHREIYHNTSNQKLHLGLKVELEPTIGNLNQECLKMCYSSLQEFSLTLLKVIVKFCEKTIGENARHINSPDATLKQNMEKEEFRNIKETISKNEEKIKRVFKQRKIEV